MGLPPKMIDKEKELRIHQREQSGSRAIAAGVKLAFGTDAGRLSARPERQAVRYLLELGLTPMQVIQMATVNAADLLGWSDRVGAVAPGHYADLIAVDGDPLPERARTRARAVRDERRHCRETGECAGHARHALTGRSGPRVIRTAAPLSPPSSER